MLTVLEHEQRAAQEEAVEDLAVFEGLEGLPEAGADLAVVALEVVIDVADLLLHVLVLRADVPDPAEDLHGLLPAAL